MNGWFLDDPESVGMDSAPLQALEGMLQPFREANVHSVLVVRRGRLVFERYMSGNDEILGRAIGHVSFNSETKHDVQSVTKSVTSLLAGIAIEQGLISSINEPVFNFFPEYGDLLTPDKERIQLCHLLTMSTGLQAAERDSSSSSERYRQVLSQPVLSPPGTSFNYEDGASELLGAILSRCSGGRLEDFARKYLFDQLGITDVDWSCYPGTDVAYAPAGLRMRPGDMAKLGVLLLNRGEWSGQQVVPAKWLDESIARHMEVLDDMGFGYLWWLGRTEVNEREVRWVEGRGIGGQRLFVVPELDLIVAITAGAYQSAVQHWIPLLILKRHVLAAIRD